MYKKKKKKRLKDPDNHDGVVTHLEPDILECEVKWALGSITTNKASGGDGILSYLKYLKTMLLKCWIQYVSKLGKLSSRHRTGKAQFSFQSQKRAMPKNVPASIQLCWFHMLARWYSKSFKLGFSIMWTKNFQIWKLSLQKAEEPMLAEIKLPTFLGP